MSNNVNDLKVIGNLFSDASKELVEKSRIKTQMRKLRTIMDSDKRRLQLAYAELGKIYYDEAEKKSAARVEILKKLISHLKERIAKAELRLSQLEVAHSVDDCAQALKKELAAKLMDAKENTAEIAKDLQEKAKKKADELKKNASKHKVSLPAEQDEEIFSAIKKELQKAPEESESAEETLSKIHNLLDSLSNDTPDEQNASKVVEAIVEEAIEEVSEKKDEVAEDFTF